MMNPRRLRRRARLVHYVPALVLAMIVPHGAHGADQLQLLPELVVTATRLPTPAGELASSLTVITADDIAARQYRTVADALRGVPGLRVTQLGGPGRLTSVFPRGANSNHTLVLVDGMEVSDPSSANGAFDFAHLLTAGVSRIEVVRGPQSGLYGSDAIGAVINVITVPVVGEPTRALRLEGGSDDTLAGAAVWRGGMAPLRLALSAGGLTTAGQSVTAARLRGGAPEEDDAYENLSATLTLHYAPDELTEIALTGRMVDSETEIDSVAEDPDAFETTQQRFARVAVTRALFDGHWESTLAAYHAHYDRDNIDRPDAVALTNAVVLDTGDRTKFEWRNDLHAWPEHVVSLGVETEAERLTDNQNTDFGFGFVISGQSQSSARTNAAYVQDQFRWREGLNATLGARIDRHEAFDPEVTYRFAPVYALPAYGLRLKGAIGTGFRAPALFELFGRTANSFGGIGTGNPNLRPETSRSIEAGFDSAPREGRLGFGAVVFVTRIDDVIVVELAFPNSTAANLGEASIRGIEAFLSATLTEHLSARLDYTFLRAEDGVNGTDLLRRPKHKVDLDVRWRPTAASTVALGLHYIGAHADVSFDTGVRVRKGGYAVVDLVGSYALAEGFTLTGRLENALDRDYEVADGFRGFGRTALFGLEVHF